MTLKITLLTKELKKKHRTISVLYLLGASLILAFTHSAKHNNSYMMMQSFTCVALFQPPCCTIVARVLMHP